MKQCTFNPFIVLALNLNSVDIETKRLKQALGDNDFKILMGKYKGKAERSYLIPVSGLDSERATVARRLAADYGQESILFRDRDNSSRLIFTQGGPDQYLGNWTNVSRAEALAGDCFSMDVETERFYICKGGLI